MAGEHAAYFGCWQESTILSSLDAITRLHGRAPPDDRHDRLQRSNRYADVLGGICWVLWIRLRSQSRRDVGFRGYRICHTPCQDCHMFRAQATDGASRHPAPAGSTKIAVSGCLVFVVSSGYDGAPWFTNMHSDSQAAALVNSTRNRIRNNCIDQIDAFDVTPLRPAVAAIRPTIE